MRCWWVDGWRCGDCGRRCSSCSSSMPRAGYDTRSVFMRKIAHLNSDSSFSKTDCCFKAKEPRYLKKKKRKKQEFMFRPGFELETLIPIMMITVVFVMRLMDFVILLLIIIIIIIITCSCQHFHVATIEDQITSSLNRKLPYLSKCLHHQIWHDCGLYFFFNYPIRNII